MQVTKCKISKITEMELFLGLWKENYMLSLNEDLFKVFSSISNIFEGLKMFSCSVTLKHSKAKNATLTVSLTGKEASGGNENA